jgi:hypothetical protein
MLAVSRTVSRGTMTAFEFLRIAERDGGLVYIAQPGGAAPTEFVLTELGGTRAVFENPRHDYPKRIVYALSAEGGLSASIGFTRGGSLRGFVHRREGTSRCPACTSYPRSHSKPCQATARQNAKRVTGSELLNTRFHANLNGSSRDVRETRAIV